MFTMAKPSLLHFSLCLLFLTSACLAERPDRFHECQLDSLNALEPDSRIESEAGVIETWNSNHPELRCAGVTVTKHTIDPQGLHLPSYTNYPELIMILQGKGVLGISVPGCSETFEEPAQSQFRQGRERRSSQSQQQQLQDSHQKIRHFREGDILAIPPGIPYWTYNDGNEKLVAINLLDITSLSNQLDPNPRRFYLAGNPEEEHPETQRQGQQQQQQSAGGRRRGQHQEEEEKEEGSNNVLSGFDPQFLAQAFSVDEQTIARLQSPDDRRKQIVRVRRGLSIISPEWQEEEEEEEEQPRPHGRHGEREERGEGEEEEEEEGEPHSRERRERQWRRRSEGKKGQRGREGEEEEEEDEPRQEGRGRESHEWERTTRRKHVEGEEGEEEEEETRTRERRQHGRGRGRREEEEEEEVHGRRQEEEEEAKQGRQGHRQREQGRRGRGQQQEGAEEEEEEEQQQQQGRQGRRGGGGRRQGQGQEQEEEQQKQGRRGSQRGRGHRQEEEEEEEQSPQERRRRGRSEESRNGLEETICTARLRENIANPSRADLYNPTAGRISTVNSLTLPILRWFQLSAEYVVLYKNGIYAPHWNVNANSVIYASRGKGWVQVVNCTGNSVFNGELRRGQLLVVPQNYVVAHQAGDEGFEFIAFKTNDLAATSQLKQVFRSIPAEVLANAFGIRLNQVSQLKYNGNQGPLVTPQSQSQDRTLIKVA